MAVVASAGIFPMSFIRAIVSFRDLLLKVDQGRVSRVESTIVYNRLQDASRIHIDLKLKDINFRISTKNL